MRANEVMKGGRWSGCLRRRVARTENRKIERVPLEVVQADTKERTNILLEFSPVKCSFRVDTNCVLKSPSD